MKQLEREFAQELQRRLETAARECGVEQKRLSAEAARYGGVSCARELLRRRRLSDGFDALARLGRLDLSLEALVTAGKYGALFTDEEVNHCFGVLCEAGCFVYR